ncbi:ATP-binding protein [Lysinibacillus sp. LZ02]|uniref:ATP-binding protein n=1 Tax=Lysinibacillus sp. LZ02 TaxID=3420668 RepID=UPI003D35D81F
METYSLSGPSGTGKSTSALEFAHQYGIEGIIDDGLLIVNGEKLAGTSAKFEKNTITAVRRAIFHDEEHRQAVIKALQEADLKSLLIIGTSDKMTKQIADRLNVAPIDHFHYVTDIRTTKEIQLAKFIRETQGKHVMPIPHAQVEQNFFKRFIQKGREIFFKNKKIGETTIVRPDFHQETIDISKSVYLQVLTHELSNYNGIARFDIAQLTVDLMPSMTIVISLKAPVTYDVREVVRGLQQQISGSFLLHFGIEPEYVNIVVKGIK